MSHRTRFNGSSPPPSSRLTKHEAVFRLMQISDRFVHKPGVGSQLSGSESVEESARAYKSSPDPGHDKAELLSIIWK